MNKTAIKYIFLFLALLASGRVMAGWPVGKRHYVLSASHTLYAANMGWDKSGKLQKNEGSFLSQSLGVYGAYGITRTVDLIASVPFTYQTSKAGAYSSSAFGLSDMQLGLSMALKNFNYSNYISLYIGGVFPLYKNTETRVFGLGNTGAALRLSNSGGLGKGAYYNIEGGVTKYIGVDGPLQASYDATVGLKLGRWDQLSFNFGGVYSQSSDKRFSLNTFAVRDYAYSKAAIGYGHSFTKRFTMYINGFYTVMGRNTGQGYGGSISAMMKLPYYGKGDDKYLR